MWSRIASYIILGIIAISIFSSIAIYTYGETDYYISYFEDVVNYYVKLAEDRGLELPDELNLKLENVRNLIETAKKESSPLKRYDYLVKAMLEFSPILTYVEERLDKDYKVDMAVYREAIDRKWLILNEVNESIDDLKEDTLLCFELEIQGKNTSIYRDFCIDIDLERLKELVNQAIEKLRYLEENLDSMSEEEILKVLEEIDAIINEITSEINSSLSSKWKGLGLIVSSYRISDMLIQSVITSIEKAITLIEKGEYKAASIVLKALELRLANYIEILKALRNNGEEIGLPKDILNVFDGLIDLFTNIRGLIAKASAALDEGDEASALSYLDQAVNLLTTYITRNSPNLITPDDVLQYVMNLTDQVRDRIRIRMGDFLSKNKDAISKMLDSIESELEALLLRFESGALPKQVFIMMLKNIRTTLVNIKERVGDKVSPEVLNRIDSLIQYIDELLSKYS